jgi:hypothetical protein
VRVAPSLIDIFDGLEGSGIEHPLPRYRVAFAGFERRASGVIAIGGDSIVLRLEDGDVLHVTNKILTPALGRRPFDLPMLERGAQPSPGGMDVWWFTQPEAQTPVSEAEMRAFQARIGDDGWLLSDRSPSQLGTWRGEVYLLDPFAAERDPFSRR